MWSLDFIEGGEVKDLVGESFNKFFLPLCPLRGAGAQHHL